MSMVVVQVTLDTQERSSITTFTGGYTIFPLLTAMSERITCIYYLNFYMFQVRYSNSYYIEQMPLISINSRESHHARFTC